MSNFVKQINGVFTISLDGKEHPNLVVNTGLSNIFKDGTVASLCETLKVFNDDSEVVGTDTDFALPVASSSNVTKVFYGVGGDGLSDYFYMRRTWTFAQGQIEGVISKLAVYSDDGTLYAAALLKTADGTLDPVRPLLAPKVEITYESRWHFKQGDNFTVGTEVFFSEAGMVNVKTNMASKNDQATYNQMNSPFRILDVELFSGTITTDDLKPVDSLGVVDPVDYSVTYIDGVGGAYGQKLNLLLPKSKYISDTPIATIVINTTRGKWQLGFDAPLEKPTLSKREIEINIPFVHGTVGADGQVTPTGDPDETESLFSTLLNSTYNVSARSLTYDNVGKLTDLTPAYFGTLKDTTAEFKFTVPVDDTVTILMGDSLNAETYLDGTVEGIMLQVASLDTLKGFVDDVAIDELTMEFTEGDTVSVVIIDGVVTITNLTTTISYNTTVSALIPTTPTATLVGVKNATTASTIIVY